MSRFRETVPIDDYVLDVLMRDLVSHDQQPAAYLVYLHLYRQAERNKWKPVSASLRTLAEAGYRILDAPVDPEELIHRLLSGPTNGNPGGPAEELLSFADYSAFFVTLPPAVQPDAPRPPCRSSRVR